MKEEMESLHCWFSIEYKDSITETSCVQNHKNNDPRCSEQYSSWKGTKSVGGNGNSTCAGKMPKRGSTCCLGNQTDCVIPKHACRNWSYVVEKVTSFIAGQVILDLQKITDFIYLSGCQSARWRGKSQSESAAETQKLFNTWMQTGTLYLHTVYRNKEHEWQSQYAHICACVRDWGCVRRLIKWSSHTLSCIEPLQLHNGGVMGVTISGIKAGE